MKLKLLLLVFSLPIWVFGSRSETCSSPVLYRVEYEKYGASFILEISFLLAGGTFSGNGLILFEEVSDLKYSYSIALGDDEVGGDIVITGGELGKILAEFSKSEVFSLPQDHEAFEPDGISLVDGVYVVERVAPFGSRRIVRDIGQSVPVNYIVDQMDSFFEDRADRISENEKELIRAILSAERVGGKSDESNDL